jgi:hypothetical protein
MQAPMPNRQARATAVTIKTVERIAPCKSMPVAKDIGNPILLVRNAPITLPAKKEETKTAIFAVRSEGSHGYLFSAQRAARVLKIVVRLYAAADQGEARESAVPASAYNPAAPQRFVIYSASHLGL